MSRNFFSRFGLLTSVCFAAASLSFCGSVELLPESRKAADHPVNPRNPAPAGAPAPANIGATEVPTAAPLPFAEPGQTNKNTPTAPATPDLKIGVSSNAPVQKVPAIFAPGEGVPAKNGMFRARIQRWIHGPKMVKGPSTKNEVQVEIADAAGLAPASLEVLQVWPFMKAHSHGAPKAYITKWSTLLNVVGISSLGFSMEGPWEINVHARVNGFEDTVELPVLVP